MDIGRDDWRSEIKLTKMQITVLMAVAEGKSSTEISEELYISRRTVEFHLANIYASLEVNNRTKAVVEARRLGLIPKEA